MQKDLAPLDERLQRQPDVQPPESSLAAPISFWTYGVLLGFILIFFCAGFSVQSERWSGFWLNLSSDLTITLIILVFIEQRFKSSEVQIIKDIPAKTSNTMSRVLHPTEWDLKSYANTLISQLDKVFLPFYTPRPEIRLGQDSSRIKILVGEPGIGKTTLLYSSAKSQAKSLLDDPQNSRLPIIIQARLWDLSKDVVGAVKHSAQVFYPIKDRTFNRLLRRGHLICYFDGVDECENREEIIRSIGEFHRQFPQVPLIISSRSAQSEHFASQEFDKIVIPPLSTDEIKHLLQQRGTANNKFSPN